MFTRLRLYNNELLVTLNYTIKSLWNWRFTLLQRRLITIFYLMVLQMRIISGISKEGLRITKLNTMLLNSTPLKISFRGDSTIDTWLIGTPSIVLKFILSRKVRKVINTDYRPCLTKYLHLNIKKQFLMLMLTLMECWLSSFYRAPKTKLSVSKNNNIWTDQLAKICL
jgi:hypothetical protein